MSLNLSGKLNRVRVESIREIADKVYVLEFHRFFEFEAGQIISIALAGNEEPRMYSIAIAVAGTIVLYLRQYGDGGGDEGHSD